MSKKYLIVGGVAGGASTAARLRRLSEEDEIIMFERGPHVSFSNCCLPYHLAGLIKTANQLVLMSPEQFKKQYNIEARVNSEVIDIDRAKKEITIKDTLTGKEYTENYDKLILSPGAKPIVPPIKGIEDINLFTVRNVIDIDKLNKFVSTMKTKNATVVGGGFIGIEVAENLKEAGFNVTLVEAMPQVMKIFDYDMVQILHKELHDKGINLIVNDKVASFEKDTVVLESGKRVEAEAVVMAIGVTPETDLAVKAGLELGELGGIKVDQNYRTKDEDVYAVGDAIEVYHALTGKMTKLPLAGPAQKQAREVADHIHGRLVPNTGYIGSSVVKCFEYNGASTGLNEGMIKALNLDIQYETVKVIPGDKVGLMPGCEPLHFKLLFEIPTGKILGAQAIGRGNVDKRVDVIATAIKFGATINDLRDLEFCYAPPFGTAKDVVNFAGYVGSNLLHDEFKQVHEYDVRDLVESGACIIDVREKHEYELSHIIGAKNIPLSEIRDRVDEIPKDQPVYLHCRSAQRSYNAAKALKHLGFDNIYNVSGGFMGISFYEYFNDQTTGREKIVTDYNFL
ncbi:pyridine nucleotide-disulfide oxidoreductase [Clostridium tetani]|uniref:Pyridine nucleotide-disulfide oxidoreductase n=1 Tax=Clostridium tetani TaxID=1513 RepID=A0A4Q0VHF1_CLOTA|nr:FAD-dependent oxidoreductase [Clostridium tetani]RXI50767.1 pyridine nucleotide-disulfide oxidoreductase [Clostridium tetani]BDR66808.1 pyridine nucleotide-disulfide oxidoreductase [Clostridium tetani]BDR72296.1 pyridine nucleotide-disulfide oxidoreductase [Clostridium tetani]BDR80771.1 pyridine nucleotide-disulfide oxidoreductase [Clostridium tetani]BDR89226.1 pyridine nucleotide-disulfide oxidoreductase [Clostridium tetani]